jgi:K+-sensing histidine kinase KdpD
MASPTGTPSMATPVPTSLPGAPRTETLLSSGPLRRWPPVPARGLPASTQPEHQHARFTQGMSRIQGILRLRKKAVLVACFAAVAAVGLVDRITGPYVALSIFYAAPIFTAAFVCGRGAGRFVAVTSALAGLAADLTNPGRLGSAYPYWNAAVRMALFVLTAEVVASLGEALRREQEVARREREAAEQLRELDRMKDSILQTIAHDLQDPLSGILAASIALVRERGVGSPDTELLTRGIASMSRKVARLIGEVLDAERMARGILDVSLRRTDVGELVRGLIEQRVLEGYPARLSVQAEPVWGSVDAAKVQRAVDELLQHVLPSAGRYGSVVVRVRERNGILITVDVVSEEATKLRKSNVALLDPGDPSGARVSVTGLHYASTIARLHGGRLCVEARLAGGSVFSLLLPGSDEEGFAQSRTGA